MPQSLALFDFDNTLSLCDSTVPFALYCSTPLKVLRAGFLVGAEKLKRSVSRKEAKELFFRETIGGSEIVYLGELAKEFSTLLQRTVMNDAMVQQLSLRRSSGARTI